MIVKTGANYQADGGYVEAAFVDNKFVTTINDQKHEYPYYATSVANTSVVPFEISKSANADSTYITCTVYRIHSMESGEDVYEHQNIAVLTTGTSAPVFAIANPIGLPLNSEGSVKCKLAEGSKDCKIAEESGTDRQYLIITGSNPIAIIDIE